jgi:predicted dehydrogenase
MLVTLDGDQFDLRPKVNAPSALGIGIVGAGWVVEEAHLPAYRGAGMRVVGITSRTGGRARALAARFGISRVYQSLLELLDDPGIAIVDIAVPPDEQPAIALQAIAAGKHVLAQKPLALALPEAQQVVTSAARAGVRLAVNQNGRFDPSINAARFLARDGLLGQRIVMTQMMHVNMDWQAYLSEPKYSRLMMLHMSIHHLDELRWLFGTPRSISAALRHVPGDERAGENLATYTVEYEDNFLAVCVDDGADWSSRTGIEYRIVGTDAVMFGQIGWLPGWQSTLAYERRAQRGVFHELRFSRSWFPDAFAATMAELMSAIEEQRAPSNSGDDNLDTMNLVFAAYESVARRGTIDLREFSRTQ